MPDQGYEPQPPRPVANCRDVREGPATSLRPGDTIRIVMEKPPGPEGCFVEVENNEGRSVHAGQWCRRDDGLWEFVITFPRA